MVQDPRCALIYIFLNEFIIIMVASVITLIPLHVGKCGNEVSKLLQKWAKGQMIHSLLLFLNICPLQSVNNSSVFVYEV